MNTDALPDIIDQSLGLSPGDPLHALRRQRAKIVDASQRSHEAMFAPGVRGLSVVERLRVALHACELSGAEPLAAHYRRALAAEGVDPTDPANETASPDGRLNALLDFTTRLIRRPIDGDRQALQVLQDLGLPPEAIVALAQLIAFLSFQVRVFAGLRALIDAGPAAADNAVPGQADVAPGTLRPSPLRIRGFTNEVLDWQAWLPPVELAQATAEQLAALEAMNATAKDQAYFRLLAHQPEMLLQRSIAYNTIMFAPGGLPRPERELAATVESRLNGCVYCTSVHAQRYEQLARRNEVIAQVFEDPATAGHGDRERFIIRVASVLGLHPEALGPAHVREARAVGLGDAEIVDLVHSDAVFAWANRLMLNLGEPVHRDGSPVEKGRP